MITEEKKATTTIETNDDIVVINELIDELLNKITTDLNESLNEQKENTSAVEPPKLSPSSLTNQREREDLIYNIKFTQFKDKRVPIILQNENGPCPLISICNVLFLRGYLMLSPQQEVISNSKLIELLADSLFNHFLPQKTSQSGSLDSNIEIILNDSLRVMEKLQYGLDVNVRFDSCSSFEYTSELDLFDLYQINLFHGWLIDPQDEEVFKRLGDKTYNQIVESAISGEQNADDYMQKLVAEQFLEQNASQMTVYGLACLHAALKNNELAILFRNNHFSTIYKRPETGALYLLVTDNGYLNHAEIVWETLDNIENDGRFCDSNFNEINTSRFVEQRETLADRTTKRNNVSNNVDQNNDYLLALSIQEQENRLYENETDNQAHSNQSTGRPSARQNISGSPRNQRSSPAENRPEEQTQRRAQSSKRKRDKCKIM